MYVIKLLVNFFLLIAILSFFAETIENECITFEIYLDAKEREIFSLYG